MKGILRGLTENRAQTDPSEPDLGLRGRTYAIPFEEVWQAATVLARGGLRGWRTVAADDQRGVIEASTRTLLFGTEGSVRIEIGLDENAQTRVDALSTSASQRGDFGRSRRALLRFFRRLDRALDVEPTQILDATSVPAWLEPS